jgi:hypothetical protein
MHLSSSTSTGLHANTWGKSKSEAGMEERWAAKRLENVTKEAGDLSY